MDENRVQGEIVVCGVPFDKGEEEAKKALAKLKADGVTAVQIYCHWNKFEPDTRGEFSFGYYDDMVRLIKEEGLKFVPFLLMGPRYSAPDWWLLEKGHKGLVCLEHGKECPVESIWNPAFREEISRVYRAFADHYLPWDVIESVQPGINGDYGEAIMPVVGNWPGAYHTHRGFWCGGEDAAASFREYLEKKFGGIEKLNQRWNAHYGSCEEVRPFLKAFCPSLAAYLDFLEWYHVSMTEYADFCMKEAKAAFGEKPVYLCTGGIEEPEHASSFTGQAKAAAKNGCGVRLTNEGNNFFENFYLTIHMQSACDYYGAYLGLEPVGPILPEGVAVRTYGSAAYGNRQIFHYYGNLYGEGREDAGHIVRKYKDLIGSCKVERKVTMFWPILDSWAASAQVSDNIRLAISEIRKSYDVNVADEMMIEDGCLEKTRVLVMLDTKVRSKKALLAIAKWVKGGGILLSNCHPYDETFQRVPEFESVFGINEDSEEVWGHSNYELKESGWMRSLCGCSRQHSMIGWNKLDDTVLPIYENSALAGGENGTALSYCAFENPYGKGKGIYFAPPLDLDAPADAIWTPSPAFRLLLEDCCRAYAGEEPMVLNEDEIIKTRVCGKELVLKKDHEIKAVSLS